MYEDICPCGVNFNVLKALTSELPLPCGCISRCELLATAHTPCWPTCCSASCHDFKPQIDFNPQTVNSSRNFPVPFMVLYHSNIRVIQIYGKTLPTYIPQGVYYILFQHFWVPEETKGIWILNKVRTEFHSLHRLSWHLGIVTHRWTWK